MSGDSSSPSPEDEVKMVLNLIPDKFFKFLSQSCHEQVVSVFKDKDPHKTHFPITLPYLILYDEHPEIGICLLTHPEQVIPIFDKIAQRLLIETYVDFKDNPKPSSSKYSVFLEPGEPNKPSSSTGVSVNDFHKKHVHIRIHSLPICPQLVRSEFPSCKETGGFICLTGTVVRVSNAKLLEYSKDYQCNRCKAVVQVTAPPTRYHAFPRFTECPNLCPNAKVIPMGERDPKNAEQYSKFKDYQEMKLQEQVDKMDFGSLPKAITVVLEDDLVNSCKPGDDIAITGYVYLAWKPFKPGFPAESELIFKANHVQVNNDQRVCLMINSQMVEFVKKFWEFFTFSPYEGRNVIVASFCPQIYGMYVVKLAMCMVLAGGVGREIAGTKIRGESHMLLVGDPGTGKSQLLKYACKITPRSVLTTGIGTSSAGLTVSAAKDNGEWHLEAGALVLADGGVCCIDEFSCIKEHDRTSIHEAMEQQSISIAKAGMVLKIPTKVTVIAATNPKGKYDPEQPLAINIGLASPLLSRFDVVMVLTDVQDDDWDAFITDFVLDGKRRLQKAMKDQLDHAIIWETERLQSYLVMIKDLQPKLSPEATQTISKYYEYQRGLEDRVVSRTTIRLLESLRRLSEGHARLCYRETVTLYDAITAISVVEASLQKSTIDHVSPCMMSTVFPKSALEEYAEQAKMILECLGLHELWEKEKLEIGKFRALEKAHWSKENGTESLAELRESLTKCGLPYAATQVRNPMRAQASSKTQQKPRETVKLKPPKDPDPPAARAPSYVPPLVIKPADVHPAPPVPDPEGSPFRIDIPGFSLSDDEDEFDFEPSPKAHLSKQAIFSFFEDNHPPQAKPNPPPSPIIHIPSPEIQNLEGEEQVSQRTLNRREIFNRFKRRKDEDE